MSKLTREDFYILNPFYRGMNNEEPLYEQDVTSRLQAIKQVKSVDGCIAALKTPGLQHTVEIAIVRKMKSLLKGGGAEAHKRNTALTVELNELCQQYGIGSIGDSIVEALKQHIEQTITAYGDGFYEGFIQGCDFGDEHGKQDTEIAALRESELAESKSFFAKSKFTSKRVAEIKAQAVSEVWKHFNGKFRPNEKLTVMQVCVMLNNHIGYLRQQSKAGAK
jgi:hypothetical protein